MACLASHKARIDHQYADLQAQKIQRMEKLDNSASKLADLENASFLYSTFLRPRAHVPKAMLNFPSIPGV